MGVRIRALTGLAVVVGTPVPVVIVLHRVGAPVRQPANMPLEIMVVEVARLAALGLAYLVLATTVTHLAALLTGDRRLIRVTSRLVLPLVRGLAARAAAGSLAVSLLAGPALAEPGTGTAPQPPGHTIDVTAPLVAGDYPPAPYRIEEERPPGVEEVMEDPPPIPAESGEAPVEPPEAARPQDREEVGEVRVRPGDSIWSLAEERLLAHLGRAPGDAETAPYWRAVVAENRSLLRSGNPDLIFPGERIRLPAPEPLIPAGS